jgi:hypothetical protein
MSEPQLENLRVSIPAARGLPLLEVLAHQGAGRTIIEYLEVTRVAVHVEPCR